MEQQVWREFLLQFLASSLHVLRGSLLELHLRRNQSPFLIVFLMFNTCRHVLLLLFTASNVIIDSFYIFSLCIVSIALKVEILCAEAFYANKNRCGEGKQLEHMS